MAMTNYYCLVAGLPDLSLEDGKLNYTVANFKSEIYPELSEKDRKLIDLFYLKFDNANLLKLLKDKEAVTDSEGNYSQDELLTLISAVRPENSAFTESRIECSRVCAECFMKTRTEQRTFLMICPQLKLPQ